LVESLNKFRQKAKSEGRKILSGITLSQDASLVLEAERSSGKSIAEIINSALLSLGAIGVPSVDHAASVIRKLRDEGRNPQQISKYLNREGVPSPGGEDWSPVDVVEAMKRLGC